MPRAIGEMCVETGTDTNTYVTVKELIVRHCFGWRYCRIKAGKSQIGVKCKTRNATADILPFTV
jgi:hypothetical protein